MALWREQVTFKSETLGIVDYVMKNNGLRHVPIKTLGHQWPHTLSYSPVLLIRDGGGCGSGNFFDLWTTPELSAGPLRACRINCAHSFLRRRLRSHWADWEPNPLLHFSSRRTGQGS